MRRWAFIAVAALPWSVGAQTVRGTVTERTSQSPIAGAVVFLLDANQAVVSRDLTTAAGSYRLTAPRSGTYRVRMLRIGFRPVMSDPVQLGADQDVTLPLVIENVPVVLNAVRVERRANCSASVDATPAYNAWNEVSTALNAALLSSRLRGTTATIVSYDRWTDGNNVVLRQGASVRTGLPGMPWRSVSADSLHRAGFVVKDASGWYTFHALDLDVLLSDTFLEDHCLQLHGVDNGEIAIEYTPSRDRGRHSEIRGFVWLSATTLELKRLQFRYVNVPREYENADAGGELHFLKLRNGTWAISKWQIHMPTAFRQERSDSYRGPLRSELRATEVKTTGGDLLRVIQNGDTLWSVPLRAFEGKVLDSATGRPVPAARVVLSGTTDTTMTDASGQFRMDDVLPGAYTVRVHTAELDSIAGFHQTSMLLVDRFADTEVRIPTASQMLAQWCPAVRSNEPGASGPPGLLFGSMNAHDGSPVDNAHVAVVWAEYLLTSSSAAQTSRTRAAVTDGRGMYRLCGVPTDHQLLFQTAFDGNMSPTPLRIERVSRTRRYDVRLDTNRRRVAPAVAAAPAAAPAQALTPVEVSAERVVIPEFEARRAAGIGHFITRADLDKAKQQRMGDLIAKVPGARVWRARTGSSAWVATGRGSGGQRMPAGDAADQRRGAGQACYADVWLDNANVYTYRVGAALFDVNSIPPQHIEAVEVYPNSATIPLRYARGASQQCGVLIIWTRR